LTQAGKGCLPSYGRSEVAGSKGFGFGKTAPALPYILSNILYAFLIAASVVAKWYLKITAE
jgi:hypothetical protein